MQSITPDTFSCCLCSKTSPNEDEFILDLYKTPMCKECHREGMSYGWN